VITLVVLLQDGWGCHVLTYEVILGV